METGRLEVIAGTMFSGKTEEMLRRLRRVEIAGRPHIAFKPATDTRSGQNRIKSNDEREIEAHEIPNDTPQELLAVLDKEEQEQGERFQVVALDEAQFFPRDSLITKILLHLVERGYRVIIAGLDRDFRGEPFGAMPDLLAVAHEVLKLPAVCKKCGENAYLPQRLIDGKPAPYNAPLIAVGGKDLYEARCEDCFVLPGKPPLSF